MGRILLQATHETIGLNTLRTVPDFVRLALPSDSLPPSDAQRAFPFETVSQVNSAQSPGGMQFLDAELGQHPNDWRWFLRGIRTRSRCGYGNSVGSDSEFRFNRLEGSDVPAKFFEKLRTVLTELFRGYRRTGFLSLLPKPQQVIKCHILHDTPHGIALVQQRNQQTRVPNIGIRIRPISYRCL